MLAKGVCLCGSIHIKVDSLPKTFGACHCGMCRTWGGGPLLAMSCGKEVIFEGEDFMQVFSSSDWAERGFCKKCGTHLFYRLKGSGEYHLPVNLIKGTDSLSFDHQIFIDEKPENYEFQNKTKNMTGAEVFASYSKN